ncbi:MAG: STAS/SEC14 domain-containing protein [Limimaricola sp.]|uniref:STAS/SEC14 domain-containing protein n=1 Tax=Limimaricola sp. TaxID=2211665 RepID=UPI001D618DC6|nr:STAS/SEC14 domain-containing protein [Limimaricola sp.]MBI1417451.1 STAS/SEC14 domain-containing protein [Limimaricola sp.]
MTKSNFTILDGFPADVVAIEAHGEITRADYEQTLIPLIEARIKAEGKIKLFYLIARDFAGYTVSAMWDDTRLGLSHLRDFARVALVTDVGWIRNGARMFAPLIPAPVHVFALSERHQAEEWVKAPGNEPPHEPGVDVTHKLQTMEDFQSEEP